MSVLAGRKRRLGVDRRCFLLLTGRSRRDVHALIVVFFFRGAKPRCSCPGTCPSRSRGDRNVRCVGGKKFSSAGGKVNLSVVFAGSCQIRGEPRHLGGPVVVVAAVVCNFFLRKVWSRMQS